MNDRDFERGLSEALQRAAGELPENAGRFRAVKQRRWRHEQRRRRVVGGLAAAAVVTVLGLGAVPLFQSQVEQAASGGAGEALQDDSAVNDAGSAESSQKLAPASCPDRAGRLGEPAPTGDGRFVPEGAVSARLCGDLPHDDVLERNVGELVSALNSLPDYDKGDCAAKDTEPLDLVLRYPDGGQVVVTFEVNGCGLARSGEQYRAAGGQDLVELYESLLSEQESND